MTRVSADKNDPGYRPIEETAHVKVFVDDVQQHFVVTADDTVGEVKRYVVASDGSFPSDGNGEILTETVRGAVRIEGLG